MRFFTEDASLFFLELEANNNREWFEANRKRYETSVKQPMERFASVMIERMKEVDPAISMEPKECLFRIYRDVRFSKDKSPYKTNAGMVVGRGGRTDHAAPGLYFQFDGHNMGIASGCYTLDPEQLTRIRRAIVIWHEEFAELITDPGFLAAFGEVRGEKNKALLAEFKEAAGQQPLLYNKQFYYWQERPLEDLTREDLPDLIMSAIRKAWPLNEFFFRALEDSRS